MMIINPTAAVMHRPSTRLAAKLARGGYTMVSLDTYRDNLCLWRLATSKRKKNIMSSSGISSNSQRLQTIAW